MIIDALTHITPDGSWFHTGYDAGVERLLREMDMASVERAVVVALAGYISNEFVAQVCSRYPDRLIPGASLDPTALESTEKAPHELRRLQDIGNFKLIKLHPRLNGYDPLDPRCLDLLQALQDTRPGFPVWLDSLFASNRCLLSKPPLLIVQTLAFSFPDLRFVLVHGCGSRLLALAELVLQFPNLTIDLSHTILYYQGSSLEADIAFVLNKRDQRTIIGSDFPEYTPRNYVAKVRHMADELSLDSIKIKNVFTLNLMKLLDSV